MENNVTSNGEIFKYVQIFELSSWNFKTKMTNAKNYFMQCNIVLSLYSLLQLLKVYIAFIKQHFILCVCVCARARVCMCVHV